MLDSGTVGSLTAGALSMAAEAILKGVVKEGAKDAYRALKAKIATWASSDVEVLERTPGSENQRAIVANEIDRLPQEDKAKVQSLALALIDELKKQQLRGPIGIDIGRLEAAEVELKNISVFKGTGLLVDEIKSTGVSVEGLTVRKDAGKIEPVAETEITGIKFSGHADIGFLQYVEARRDRPTREVIAEYISEKVGIDSTDANNSLEQATLQANSANPGDSTGFAEGLKNKSLNERQTKIKYALVEELADDIANGLGTGFFKARTRSAITGLNGTHVLSGIEIEDSFIKLIEKMRRSKNFAEFNERYPRPKEYLSFIVRTVRDFDNGMLLSSNERKELIQVYICSRGIAAKVFLADLIIAQDVRAGRGLEALDWIDQFDNVELVEPAHRAFYIEKTFSTRYTTLLSENFLEPSRWDFDKALARFNELGSFIGMPIAKAGGSYELRGEPDVNEENIRIFTKTFGPNGFNALFWVLQYLAARAEGSELTELAGFQYRLLSAFANPKLELNRAAWNMCFIIALQLHRKVAFGTRNKFLKALVDQEFWGTDIRQRLAMRADNLATDMMVVCFVLFVESQPDVRALVHDLGRELSLDRIEMIGKGIKPQRIGAATDVIRKLREGELSFEEVVRKYLVGDRTLEVYTGPLEALMKALAKR